MTFLMPRRKLLKSAAPALLLPATARAQFSNQRQGFWSTPGNATLSAGGGAVNSITITVMPSTGSPSSTVTFSYSYTGAAPTGFTYSWSGGGGSGSATGVTSSTATVATPSSTGTYTLSVTGTGPNTSGPISAPNSTTIGSTRTVPLGGYLTSYTGNSGSAYYSTLSAHWTGFNSALGKTADIFGGAICGNAAASYTPCTPDQWPGTVSSQISSLSFLPANCPLMLTWPWQDNSGNTLYTDMATTTNTSYGGHLIAYWVQQTLATWKAAGYTTLYVRPNWEWNIGNNWAATVCGAGISTAVFVQAFTNFCTLCQNYANANGMTIYVCWNASVFGETDFCGYTLTSQFPNPPGSNVIVCSDFYAEGGELANGAAGGSTTWSLRNMVSIAQTWGLPIGFCELGGLYYPSGGSSASITWIPNLISYVNSIGSTTSCAFAMLYDENQSLDATPNVEFTAPGAGQSGIVTAWKNAVGPGGSMVTIP